MKKKNVLSTILLVVLAAILGYYIWNNVAENLKAEEPAEAYVLKFEGGPIDELDISEYYVEDMTWGELLTIMSREPKEYTIMMARTFSLQHQLGDEEFEYYSISINGESLEYSTVIDFSATYTLTLE